jgi:hypothetical protein
MFLGLGGFTFLKAGIFAFPTLFLFALGLVNLIISDFKYTSAFFETNKISISKGFMLFKNRKFFNIFFHDLVSAGFYSENSKDETVMLTFLNSDNYFYEETCHLNITPDQKQNLTLALRNNFIWVKAIN